MISPELDDIQRSILAFICRHIPPGANPPVFETRNTICGELRLALHEYDEACMGLTRLRLIVTDQPYANDCDFIAPTPAGRAVIHDIR